MFDRLKKIVKDAQQEIEETVSDKLMEEEVKPTLRQHKGEPLKPKDGKTE